MERRIAEAKVELIGEGRTAEIYAWGDGQALKLYRTGWPASWVEHEARVHTAVAATGLPVPAVGGTLELDGRYGVLFERVSGPSLLRQFNVRPWTVTQSLRVFTDLHLTMSRQRVPGLPSQREELARRIQGAFVVSEGIRAAALERLDQLPDDDALCNGDYHPDNVLMARTGPIIIDWGSASSGYPLADVAQTELLLQVGEPPLSSLSRADLAAWRLPIAVARLGEGIAGEREKLLSLIERAH